MIRLAAALLAVVAMGEVQTAPVGFGPLDAEQAARAELWNQRLLASANATMELQRWCDERAGMPAGARITATLLPGSGTRLSPTDRRRLGLGPDDPVAYRHVRLECMGILLSEADNWYVPDRLTPEMQRQLTTTRTPFGAVIQPLRPRRQNRLLRADGGAILFEHEGLVTTAAGQPLALVRERYQRALVL